MHLEVPIVLEFYLSTILWQDFNANCTPGDFVRADKTEYAPVAIPDKLAPDVVALRELLKRLIGLGCALVECVKHHGSLDFVELGVFLAEEETDLVF